MVGWNCRRLAIQLCLSLGWLGSREKGSCPLSGLAAGFLIGLLGLKVSIKRAPLEACQSRVEILVRYR